MSHDAEYQARYREQRPDYVKRSKIANQLRRRALQRLAEAHPDEYARLLADEEAAAGFVRIGLGGPGVPKRPLQ